jgi:uncharacterized protein
MASHGGHGAIAMPAHIWDGLRWPGLVESIKETFVHYLLMYELAPDYLARRGEFRNEHLKLAWEAEQRGEIVIAGALADPADYAVLLFTGDSPEVAERFAKADPYVTEGLVKTWIVRPWTTVVGKDAATPVRPE